MSSLPSTLPPARRSGFRWVIPVLVSLGLVLGGMLLLAIVTLSQGAVHGMEFCPQTFETRTFLFLRIPGLGLQVTPTERIDYESSVRPAIQKLKPAVFAEEVAEDDKRWDILFADVGAARYDGEAATMATYLGITGGFLGDDYFGRWTREHPEPAQVVWSAAAQAARRGRYYVIPFLFDAAFEETDVEKLKARTQRILAAAKD